jgi:hypothetical protein
LQRSELLSLDVQGLDRAEKAYGSSWKARGGVGAFMVSIRKFDRIVVQMRTHLADFPIEEAIQRDGRSEGLIDDIRDFRRYLILIGEEITGIPKHKLIETIPVVTSWSFQHLYYLVKDLEAFVQPHGWDIFRLSRRQHETLWEIIATLVEMEYRWALLYPKTTLPHRDNHATTPVPPAGGVVAPGVPESDVDGTDVP